MESLTPNRRAYIRQPGSVPNAVDLKHCLPGGAHEPCPASGEGLPLRGTRVRTPGRPVRESGWRTPPHCPSDVVAVTNPPRCTAWRWAGLVSAPVLGRTYWERGIRVGRGLYPDTRGRPLCRTDGTLSIPMTIRECWWRSHSLVRLSPAQQTSVAKDTVARRCHPTDLLCIDGSHPPLDLHTRVSVSGTVGGSSARRT